MVFKLIHLFRIPCFSSDCLTALNSPSLTIQKVCQNSPPAILAETTTCFPLAHYTIQPPYKYKYKYKYKYTIQYNHQPQSATPQSAFIRKLAPIFRRGCGRHSGDADALVRGRFGTNRMTMLCLWKRRVSRR